MGEEAGAGGTQVTGTRDPQEIREEIEATRREMGETVEALAAKTDVKAQAKEKVAHAKESVTHKGEELVGKAKHVTPDTAVSAGQQIAAKARAHPAQAAAAGAFALGFAIGRRTRR
jgi:hypothetical protein